MQSRCLAALVAVLFAVPFAAGCGSNPAVHSTKTLHAPMQHCSPSDYAMGCALAPIGANPSLTLVPAVAHGVDFAWGGPSAASMHTQGFAFGASYLSPDASKNWTLGLVRSYAARGIARVFVWESSATRALSGCGAGRSDARSARGQAVPFGARVIYFAVDFEVAPSETSTVASYFRCASAVLGVSHTGGYGGLATIRLLFDRHLVRYGWQTYAWSGGTWDRRAQLQQYLNGNAFDYDRAVAKDYGQTPFSAGPTPAQQRAAKRASLASHKHERAALHGDIDRHHCRRGQHVIPRQPLSTRRHLHNALCPRWIKRGGVDIAVIKRLERELG